MIAVVVIVVLALAGGASGGVLLLTSDDGPDETIDGDGYSYEVPNGWSEMTEIDVDGIDSAVQADQAEDGFRTNILVEVDSAAGITDPAKMRTRWESNIADAVGGAPEPIEGTTIDGQEAIGARVEITHDGVDLVQIEYLAINDNQAYTIALGTSAGAEDEAAEEFERVLDSWSWQESQENV